MTSRAVLLAQARQGNPNAIAALINQSLKLKSATIQVRQKGELYLFMSSLFEGRLTPSFQRLVFFSLFYFVIAIPATPWNESITIVQAESSYAVRTIDC